jgi:hypothetical protein
MTANIAAQENGVAWLNAFRGDDVPMGDEPNPACIDEDAVPFAPIHNLDVSGDQLDLRHLYGAVHGLHHTPEGFHG